MSQVPVDFVKVCPLTESFHLASQENQKFRRCGEINIARAKAQSNIDCLTSSQMEMEWATDILKEHPTNVYAF